MSSNTALLEVIALGARDAERAQEGGADRLELVSDMASDGLTPSEATVREVLGAADLPVRVMLRAENTFDARAIDELRASAARLVSAGAQEFVFGFLTEDGEVDAEACRALLKEIDGRPWTFHRAIDRSRDPIAAYDVLAELGCATVLAAGTRTGSRGDCRCCNSWRGGPTVRRCWSAAVCGRSRCTCCGPAGCAASTWAARFVRPGGTLRWTRPPCASGPNSSKADAPVH